MKIKKFSTLNWMGAPDAEYKPGALTILSGKNGSGKTSIVAALQYAVGSGHDPSVIRVGAEVAKVEIQTDDDTTIKIRVTPKSTTRDITDAKGRKITRQAEFIKSIVSSLSLDPVALLSMPPREQMNAIIAAAPLRVTVQDLTFVPVKALEGISLDAHALEVLEQIRKHIYDDRTGINRVFKDKNATIEEMKRALPEDAPEGNWDDVLKRSTQSFQAVQKEKQKRALCIIDDARKAEEAQAELFRAKRESIKEQAQTAIDKIRTDSEISIQKHQAERDHKLAAIANDKDGALKAAEAEYQPKIIALTTQAAHARAMAEQHAKAESTREFIALQEQQAKQAEQNAEKLTGVLGKLESLKKTLASSLPVPGLEITEAGLTLDGIPFQRVNKAKQIQVALTLAKLQAGELGLIVIDDMEHLDSKSFEAFRQAAEASGLQFVAARVTDDELTVLPGQLAVPKASAR
jgi:DNA repair ATPase RecN